MQESGTGLQPGALYLAATPVLFLKCLADARQLDVPLALLLHRLVLGHAALQGIHVRRAVDSEPGAKEAVPLLGLIVFALGVLLKRLIEPGIGRAPRVVPGSLSRHPSLDRSVGLLSGLDGLLMDLRGLLLLNLVDRRAATREQRSHEHRGDPSRVQRRPS